ncbi:MAG: hypothetical protein ACKOQ6_00250, partial [Bacteroidota bacterium]
MRSALLLFFCTCISLLVSAQSFGPGYILVSGGAEFGAGYVILDDPDPISDVNGSTVFRNIPINLEVGVTEHMGIGLNYRKCSYLGNTDSVKSKANEYGFFYNYHFVVTKQTNSFAGVRLALSDFSFEKTRTSELFRKSGPALQIYGGVNMLILSNLGLQFTLGLNTATYQDG